MPYRNCPIFYKLHMRLILLSSIIKHIFYIFLRIFEKNEKKT